jgi:hypothetical protein
LIFDIVVTDSPSYEEAKALEKSMKYREALSKLRRLNFECPCIQIKLDMERIIDAIYGVKGSDNTVSIWESVPLMTQTEPTLYEDYAYAQLGRKIYRHGDINKLGMVEPRDELWEFDIDIHTRIWGLLETGGACPGCRYGHTMWTWKNALYLWGGYTKGRQSFDAKLYCLALHENAPLVWKVVKTAMKPPGRYYHAGVLYKNKYLR